MRLAEEFHRPEGPRGRRGHCEADQEIEERLREKLQAIVPCPFAGEETGLSEGKEKDYLWMVDPHDGTFEFMSGRRGSAVSVGLLKNNIPILGVVCSPLSPDRGKDTIAWGEGEPAILRKHVLRNALVPVITVVGLELGTLLSGSIIIETVFAWPGSGSRWSSATQPGSPRTARRARSPGSASSASCTWWSTSPRGWATTRRALQGRRDSEKAVASSVVGETPIRAAVRRLPSTATPSRRSS